MATRGGGGGVPKWPTRYSTSVSEAEAGGVAVYSIPGAPRWQSAWAFGSYISVLRTEEPCVGLNHFRPGTAMGLNPHRSDSSKKPREETLSGKNARRSLFDFYCASLEFRV